MLITVKRCVRLKNAIYLVIRRIIQISSMLRLSVLFLIGNSLVAWAQHPRIGGYNIYYGSLHNHCEVSDGTGTPYEAYNTAKNIAGLDFFSLSDHAEYMSPSEWNTIRNTADIFNENGTFAAFWGFEWSSVRYGHLSITGSGEYCSSISPATSTFIELNRWVDARNCVAFLAHPGDFNNMGSEFNHFNIEPSLNIVGMELWSGTKGFERYYYNDGYNENDGGLGFYDEMLIRGWKTGASGACDMHGSNWGSGSFRMAVLAASLSRENLMEAFRARRFYATLDKNLEMSFKIQGMEMGSILEPGYYNGEIRLHDADQEIFTKAEVVGNGQVIRTFSFSETDPLLSFDIDAHLSDYYYIIATQEDGDQAISSPIFIDNEQVFTVADDTFSNTDRIFVRYSTDRKLLVRVSGSGTTACVVITDMSGRKLSDSQIMMNESVEISLSGYRPGIYLLLIPGHPEYSGQKIILW